jgi:hypothetical protein
MTTPNGDGVGVGIVPLIFVVIGLIVRYVPARILLMFDRQTGYRLYKNAPTEEIGLERARKFYRWFGLFFAVIGSLALILINKDYIRSLLIKWL